MQQIKLLYNFGYLREIQYQLETLILFNLATFINFTLLLNFTLDSVNFENDNATR